jgi:uncharacterized cupredoxin-like copper-binding protein
MKTPILLTTIVFAASLAMAEEKTLGEKTADTLGKAKEKTKEAGRAVVDGTKKAAAAVADAVTPDKDAHRVDVKLADHRIELPKKVAPGKTAFVVTNAGTTKHNFEVEGQGLEKKFMLDLAPNETKTLHVELKPGTYKLSCPLADHGEKGMTTELKVQ